MIWILLLITQSLFSGNIANWRREDVKPMKVSVVIPCVPEHFKHVSGLLECYAMQTAIPDEVVISLSEAGRVREEEIATVENQGWPFHLKIIQTETKRSAGGNRNTACAHSSGDLIICQDADDLPHPQRVELVKSLFEQYEIDHLIHLYTRSSFEVDEYDKTTLLLSSELASNGALTIKCVTNGNACFTRNVFNKVRWRIDYTLGEDISFNRRVYKQFKHCVMLHLPLLLYRNEFSSFR